MSRRRRGEESVEFGDQLEHDAVAENVAAVNVAAVNVAVDTLGADTNFRTALLANDPLFASPVVVPFAPAIALPGTQPGMAEPILDPVLSSRSSRLWGFSRRTSTDRSSETACM